jgi:hypothetical protein
MVRQNSERLTDRSTFFMLCNARTEVPTARNKLAPEMCAQVGSAPIHTSKHNHVFT